MAITELSPDSTEHLVQQSRDGDESAFAALVESHQSAVFGNVLRLVSDREVAAEVSNRAFFKAYEHLASFDQSRPLRAWLLRIAANEALNELRRRRRDAAHTFGGAEAEVALEHISGAPDPGEIVSRRERSAAIRDAVSRLPEPQRVLVVLRYFADLAYADIAELTQQSVNSVGVNLPGARRCAGHRHPRQPGCRRLPLQATAPVAAGLAPQAAATGLHVTSAIGAVVMLTLAGVVVVYLRDRASVADRLSYA